MNTAEDKIIPFNKPFFSGNELKYIEDAVKSGKISGDGNYTRRCKEYFEKKLGYRKVLLTTSCTDALEMAAILLDIKDGDEVIAPSYTFVSTVNAFVLRGAKIVFADSFDFSPNMDVNKLEDLITPKTKVIIPVHYAGIACDMDKIMELAKKYNLFVVEDAAQAIDSFYKGRLLGSIGHMAAFSFHETKNIISGEGGLLVVNDERFYARAEIIREKGTNRSAFFRGEIDKYGWVDVGSSFLPSDIIAAYLYAQLENFETIQNRRKNIWNRYNNNLKPLLKHGVRLPVLPEYSTINGHMYYIITRDIDERNELITYLKSKNILAVFHYISLHKSKYFNGKYFGSQLFYADFYTDCLLRLPLFYELSDIQIDHISEMIINFYENRQN